MYPWFKPFFEGLEEQLVAEIEEDKELKQAPTMTVRVPKCASCGKEHDGVEVKALATPQKPFTHWFTCPETGDPVPMALLMVDDQTAVAVHSQILQGVMRCLLARRYMMAFFRVEQGRIFCDPTVYDDFPNGDFGRAVGLLHKHLCERLDRQTLDVPGESGLIEQAAKPMAAGPAVLVPKVKLFGEDGGEQYKAP